MYGNITNTATAVVTVVRTHVMPINGGIEKQMVKSPKCILMTKHTALSTEYCSVL